MRVTRREALAAGAGAALIGATPGWAKKPRDPFARSGSFGQGVASGVPGQRDLLLWTRIDGHDRAVRIGLEVALDEDFRRVIHRSTPRAAPVRDHTVHARVRARALRPGEEYWYRFYTRAGSSPVGRVRTARPPDSREPVRIAFFSCQGWQPGYFNAHADMAKQDLDLAVCMGDYIYEKTDDIGPRQDTIGRERNGFCQTLGEYREKWRQYRSDPDLRAMHSAHPYVAVPDNHELASDDAGHIDGAPIYVPLRERIRHGLIAYFENVPLDRDPKARTRIHRSVVLGRHAEVILFDWGGNYPQDTPSAWMPGGREFVFDRLEQSPATWKLLGSQKMMMALDVPATRTLNPGQWDGIPEERRALMQHILDKQIKGVTVASGDIHTFFAGRVTTTGRIDGTPAATEFIGGGITSEPGPEMIFGDDGAPLTADAFRAGADANNPHFAFSEHLHSGYAILECRERELNVTFRAVESKAVRPSPAFDLARFRVPVEEPRVERIG